ISSIQAEQKDASGTGGPRPVKGGFMPEVPRIPLFVHKQKLVDFLSTREAATRVQIIKATGIPAGSLSSLLKSRDFAQVRHGYWALKGQGKAAPSTPAPAVKE